MSYKVIKVYKATSRYFFFREVFYKRIFFRRVGVYIKKKSQKRIYSFISIFAMFLQVIQTFRGGGGGFDPFISSPPGTALKVYSCLSVNHIRNGIYTLAIWRLVLNKKIIFKSVSYELLESRKSV